MSCLRSSSVTIQAEALTLLKEKDPMDEPHGNVFLEVQLFQQPRGDSTLEPHANLFELAVVRSVVVIQA